MADKLSMILLPAMGVLSAVGVAAAAGWAAGRRTAAEAAQQLQAALTHEQNKRAADRAGRVRAEQKLREASRELASLQATARLSSNATAADSRHVLSQDGDRGSHEAMSDSTHAALQQAVFPLTPIGTLKSCFTDRRGTPRQPHLVPGARAVLSLEPGVPAACLRGLEGFSHCWVLYVFHKNTDLAKVMATRAGAAQSKANAGKNTISSSGGSSSSSSSSCQVKALVSVPRLNGAKMGVLATRSPHRPVPLGLSTAKVVSVDAAAGVLVLGGVDVVDGSPVLDIKPYVPFSDALPGATAPLWVTEAADDEPLELAGVLMDAAAEAAVCAAWRAVRHQSVFSSAQQLVALVQQVLSRDIRSVHQRRHVAPVAVQQQQQCGLMQQESIQTQEASDDSQLAQQPGTFATSAVTTQDNQLYKVSLDGVEVTYRLTECGHVVVQGAEALVQGAEATGTQGH